MQRINLNGVWSYHVSENEDNSKIPDSNQWGEMNVPSNWYLCGLPNHAGVVWFRRKFSIKKDDLKEKEVWLNFEGVDYYAEVWLNGNHVGKHEGYFQSFRFKVTDFIKDEENELIVKVDSPFEEPGKVWPDRKRLIKGVLNHHDCRPGAWHPTLGQSGNTGGIWGNVELLVTEKIVIERIKVTTESISDHTAQLKFNLEISNVEKKLVEAGIHIKIFFEGKEQSSFDDEIVLKDSINHLEYHQTIADPHLWWTWDYGNPDLYRAKVIVEWLDKSAENETDFGIRTICQNKAGQYFLNDQPIFIRGTNVIPTQWFSSYREKEIQKDIDLLRNANINAVRIHAHVTKPEFYSACDKAGLLIWQDFPLQWGYVQTDEFVDSAERQIQEMVESLYNHPSVYLWCCHNEPPIGTTSFDESLAKLVREKDPLRSVHPASTFEEHPYYGWYSGYFEQFIGIPGGPIPSEFGAQALPVLESLKEMMPKEALWPPDWEIWAFHDFQYDQTFNVVHLDMGNSLEAFIKNSQEYQYHCLKYSIEAYRRTLEKPVFGLFQFMFMDCWPAITWSVVDFSRRIKPGYDALKIAYQPVLLSFDIPRLEIVNDITIFDGVYLTNDLNVGFENAVAEITLEDSNGKELIKEDYTVNIPAYSRQCLVSTNLLSTGWRVPGDLDPGEVTIRGRVKSSDGKLLSENFEDLKIVKTYAKDFAR